MLDAQMLWRCHHTISSNAFFCIVCDAIDTHRPLSVVRAADGERKLMDHVHDTWTRPELETGPLLPFGILTKEWLVKYGCDGIPRGVLRARLMAAFAECTYCAPSISGVTMPAYDAYGLFTRENQYVDNFFPNLWSEEQKADLFQRAGHVLFIHANRGLADALQKRAWHYHRVRVSYLPLSNWDQAEGVIRDANEIAAPLTIFSGGPASKYIGPRIQRVTLDIGAAAVRWTFLPRFEQEKAKATENGTLETFMRNPYGEKL